MNTVTTIVLMIELVSVVAMFLIGMTVWVVKVERQMKKWEEDKDRIAKQIHEMVLTNKFWNKVGW